MRIWLVSFLILLALTRGLDWLHHLSIPFPVLLLGGAMLSILSNESTLAGLPWMPRSQPSLPEETVAVQTLTSQTTD